jgi:hypothetical protein
MSSDMISPVPAPRIDTLVEHPVTGLKQRRTDYAGTVWYGGRPQVMGGMVVSRGGGAQISTPFWLPDSHAYDAQAAAEAQVQASAALQSVSDHGQILEVAAALGEDPQGGGAMRVYVAISATARVPLGVSYRVTVITGADAVQAGQV